MPDQTQRRALVEVHLDTEPVSGFVVLDSGRRLPFRGCIELLAVLRRLQQATEATAAGWRVMPWGTD
jgi:hypothetical protein